MKLFRIGIFILFFITNVVHLKSANYYWIGGSGNWSDINHWAQSTGGYTLHTVVPQITDNVFIDNNSGFTINDTLIKIDGTVATCKNLQFLNNINSIILDGNPLHIYGSLLLQSNTTLRNSIFFKSNSNETITSNGAIIKGNLSFSNNGIYQLTDSLHSQSSINISTGKFITNGFKLSAVSFAGTNCNIDIVNSIIRVNSWLLNGASSIIQANNSSLYIVSSFTGQTNHQYNNITFTNAINANLFAGSIIANTLFFEGSGLINGNNTINALKFSAGKNYRFESNTVQKINTLWDANTSSCTGLMEIFSTNNNIAATVDVAAGATVQLANAIVKSINITGFNLPIVAPNSFDFGNNSNIQFPIAVGKTLYWVGGAGSWNDALHWSFTNNGIYPSVNGCVPTPLDDVVFNINSGFIATNEIVNLNLSNQYCKNILCQNVNNIPILFGTKLSVFGSFTLQPNMAYNVSETFFLSNNSTETITTNGTKVNSDLFFNGNAIWNIMDDLNVGLRSINLQKGTVNTNNFTINGSYFKGAAINGTIQLNLGSSQIYMLNGWSYSGALINTLLNAGTSHIHLGGFFLGTFSHTYYDISFIDTLVTSSLDGSIYAHNVVFNGNAKISGNNQFYNLSFAAAKIYTLIENGVQKITNSWMANTPICSGLMEIKSDNPLIKTNIDVAAGATVSVSRVLFQSVHYISSVGSLNAPNCFDYGNNDNIVFPAATSTTYYWVGGAGNWSNKEHWSTINNGIYPSTNGCVPTPLDNIVFNNNSGFTPTSNIVNANLTNLYCNNITWTGVNTNAFINGISYDLHVFGNIELQATASINLNNINLVANSGTISINTNGAFVNAFLHFIGNSNWQLLGNIKVEKTIFYNNGNLNTNNFSLQASGFSGTALYGNTNLNLGNSLVKVINWNYTSNNFATINNLKSSIYAQSFIGNTNHKYHNIIIDSAGTVAGAIIANKIWFKNNGALNGNNTVDTLIFTFGKEYVLQKNATQTIQKIWYPNGNPCFITRIISSQLGIQANLKLNYSPAIFDFIYVKDINASTSLSILTAQSHSTNDGNNTNFIFVPYNNNGIVGLGNDSLLNCTLFPFTLLTTSFYPNPETSFLWQNGSTANQFVVQDSGKYSILVNYGEGCLVKDTISITRTNIAGLRNVQAAICANQSYTLPSGLIVNSAGVYKDTITNNIGCDSIITTTLQIKISNLATQNKTICPGTNYTLPNGQIVSQPGIYTTTLTNIYNCDSIIVTNLQMQSMQHLQITPIQSICLGRMAQLQVHGANSYLWTPSSSLTNANISNPIASPTTTTTYIALVTDSICNLTKTLQTQIIVQPLPLVQIQKSNDLDCNKNTAILSCNNNLQTYKWTPNIGLNNTNQSTVIAQPTNTTTYSVLVQDNLGCINSDTIQVKVVQRVPNLPIANIFTPNNDGNNDCFGVNYWGNVSNFTLYIYNRWGQKIFYTDKISSCWNGTFQNSNAPVGTYVYFIKAYDECLNKNISKKGTVVLVR